MLERIYQIRMGDRRRSHARKDLWFPEPMQLPVNGQWWSNSATHLAVWIGWEEMLTPVTHRAVFGTLRFLRQAG